MDTYNISTNNECLFLHSLSAIGMFPDERLPHQMYLIKTIKFKHNEKRVFKFL